MVNILLFLSGAGLVVAAASMVAVELGLVVAGFSLIGAALIRESARPQRGNP